MGALDGLLQQVTQAITQHHEGGNDGKLDAGALIGRVTDMFQKHPQNGGAQPKPASQDPYGDPANQQGGGAPRDVKPASQDPYGDPADEKGR